MLSQFSFCLFPIISIEKSSFCYSFHSNTISCSKNEKIHLTDDLNLSTSIQQISLLLLKYEYRFGLIDCSDISIKNVSFQNS